MMKIDRYRIDVGLLVLSQALYLSASIGTFTFGGLVGGMLTPVPALATLPISLFAIGTAIMAIPMSLLMKRLGRRRGFYLAICAGVMCGVTATTAILIKSFVLFCAATLLMGCYQSGAMFYRFAAMEVAPSHYRSRAVSYVIAGGILAALCAPIYYNSANALFDPITFLGAYIGVILVGLLAFIPISLVRFPKVEEEDLAGSGQERPLKEIIRQPVFLAAVANGCGGYALMHLVMTAAPVAIVSCGFSPNVASYVIQWHILAMTVPAFVTGMLIQKVGVIRIMMTGMALYVASAFAGLTGLSVAHFGTALVLVGVGWNFMFTSGTTLLADSHTPAERAKVQGINDFFVFGGSALASLSAGSLLAWFGWASVQYALFAIVSVVGTLTIWYAFQRKRPAIIVE